MPQVCSSLPLAIEVCTPSYGGAERIEVLEWDAGLRIDVEPIVTHYPCDDTEARRAQCEGALTRCDVNLAGCQGDLGRTRQQLEQQTTMYRATQQRLAECRQAQAEPDLSSAWVLGALALGGVVARWLR